MILKRKHKLSWVQAFVQALYPKGGWSRALQYVKLRLQRLPDTPEKISRGLATGVFVTFTPLFGLHFLFAALVAKIMRGNIFAALMGTFLGNPVTFIPIAIASMYLGYLFLGLPFDQTLLRGAPDNNMCGLACQFGSAVGDLAGNVWAFITFKPIDFTELNDFMHDVFYPYFLGGSVIGTAAGIATYMIATPLLRAYQKRNRTILQKKLAHLSKTPMSNL